MATNRKRNPNRYDSVNVKLPYWFAGDREMMLVVTYGLDEQRKVKAVFCSSFKAGTDMNSLAMDGSKLLSLMLQEGYTPQELSDKLDNESSLLGALIRGAMEVERENGH